MSNSILKYFKPKPSPKVEKKKPAAKVAELGGSGDDGVEVATVATDDDDVGATHGGGLGGETEHCFGSITVEPPIDLNTCTSLPSEITLEVREHALSVIDILRCGLGLS